MGLGTEPWSVSRKTPRQKGRTAATSFGLIALTGAFSVFAVTYSGAFQTWVYSRYPTVFSAARGFSTVARQGLAISLADNLLHVPLLYLPTFYLAVGTMQVTKSRKEDLALFSLRRERAHDGVSQSASTELRRSLQGKTPADIWVDVKAASQMLNTSCSWCTHSALPHSPEHRRISPPPYQATYMDTFKACLLLCARVHWASYFECRWAHACFKAWRGAGPPPTVPASGLPAALGAVAGAKPSQSGTKA